MAIRRYCIECGAEGRDVEATQTVDDDPVCAMHARVLAALSAGCAVRTIVPGATVKISGGHAPEPVGLCTRGCGKPTHRGMCKGQQAREYSEWSAPKVARTREELPKPVPVLEAMRAANPDFGSVVDGELGKIAAVSGGSEMDVLVCKEIPVGMVPSGSARNIGRLGEMWLRLMALPFGKALAVECRDADHAGSTARHMTLKARKAGVAIVSRKVGRSYYCYRVKEGEAAQ